MHTNSKFPIKLKPKIPLPKSTKKIANKLKIHIFIFFFIKNWTKGGELKRDTLIFIKKENYRQIANFL